MFFSTCQKLCFLCPYYWIFLIFYLYLILLVSISTCLPICLPIIYLLEHNCNSLQYPKCVNLFFDKFVLFNIGLNIRKPSSFSCSLYRDGHLLFWMSLFTSLQIQMVTISQRYIKDKWDKIHYTMGLKSWQYFLQGSVDTDSLIEERNIE